MSRKHLAAAAILGLGLMTSGCITVIGDHDDDHAWHGNNAGSFEVARDACRAETETHRGFIDCMSNRGWTRS